MALSEEKVLGFSRSLFWDINLDSLDLEIHKRFIIERVSSRGDLTDWRRLREVYSLDTLKSEAVLIRSLDKKTLNFLSFFLEIPKKEFRCFTQTQSQQAHWNY